MKINTKIFFVILIAVVLLTLSGFGIFHYFAPKVSEAHVDNHTEILSNDKAYRVSSPLNEELLEAAGKGDLQKVQRLIQAGADINIRGKDNTTALTTATVMGHNDIVKLLLDSESLDSKQKCAAFVWAERYRNIKAVQLFEQAGVNMADASLDDQLFYAAIKGDAGQVQQLLEKGVRLDAKNPIDNSTALMMAAEKGHDEVVMLLLDNGADISMINNFGGTALLGALSNGHADLAQLLIKRGADVNSKHSGTNITVLMMAAAQGSSRVVSDLLKEGADVNVEDMWGYTALVHAAARGYDEIVKLLINEGRWTNKKESFGKALAVAVGQGRTEIAKLLIEEGADLNEKTAGYEFTPLMIAANRGNTEIVRALIDKGADVNAKSTNGLTALQLAEKQGHIEIVRLLQTTGTKAD
jgi:ankyrin repeat protein